MVKVLLKRVLPSVIVLALLVLGALWLYGYVGVKAGWITVQMRRAALPPQRRPSSASEGSWLETS